MTTHGPDIKAAGDKYTFSALWLIQNFCIYDKGVSGRVPDMSSGVDIGICLDNNFTYGDALFPDRLRNTTMTSLILVSISGLRPVA